MAREILSSYDFDPQRSAIEPIGTIFDQSHKVRNKESLEQRDHMARPYPESDFDFIGINVPSSYQQGMIPDGEEPPWGLLRVVATSREVYGVNAGILHAHRLKLQPDSIKEQIIKTKTKLVGLNPTSVNVSEAQVISRICDELGVPYILGGIHATLDPSIARQDFPNAYAIVRGNGEVAIGEVIKAALEDGSKSDSNGVYYREHATEGRNDYAKKINPGLVPMVKQDIYIEQPVYTHKVSINGNLTEINEATLYVTDGCPFECTFCSSPVMVNRGKDVPYARPEMNRIVDEIQHVVDIGADAIHFLDDMAFIKGENIRELHKELTDRDLLGKFIWRGLTRAPVILREDFSDEVMQMMKDTGAWKIALGVESGSNEMLKKIKKKVTKEQVVDAVEKLSSYGIQVKGFFIMGFPGETEEQLQETSDFIQRLKELGLTEAGIFQFKPYPGTQEYQQLKQQNPEILERLSYLRHRDNSLSGKAQERAENHVWLSDDVKIAEVHSSRVREYVVQSLESFYGTSLDHATQVDPTCG